MLSSLTSKELSSIAGTRKFDYTMEDFRKIGSSWAGACTGVACGMASSEKPSIPIGDASPPPSLVWFIEDSRLITNDFSPSLFDLSIRD